MTETAKNIARKPRADAERNRQRLLDVAKRAFADKGPTVSLEEIARAAEVGIGTLYRHFPTRDALVEQVYIGETEQLAAAATRLAATQPPVEALRQWLGLFVGYLATKQIMAGALGALAGGTTELYAASAKMMHEAINSLLDRAVESGDIRLDIEPFDLLRAVAGVTQLSAGPNAAENALGVIDLLIAGMLVR
jgi:AcrR family transcriptional regulator